MRIQHTFTYNIILYVITTFFFVICMIKKNKGKTPEKKKTNIKCVELNDGS